METEIKEGDKIIFCGSEYEVISIMGDCIAWLNENGKMSCYVNSSAVTKVNNTEDYICGNN